MSVRSSASSGVPAVPTTRRSISRHSPWWYLKLFVLLVLAGWFLLLLAMSQTQAGQMISAPPAIGYGGGAHTLSSAVPPHIDPTQRVPLETEPRPSTQSTDPLQAQVPQSMQTQQESMFPSLGLPDPAQWLWDGITGFFNRFFQMILEFFQKQVLDWASSFGFLYLTPAALTYKNPMVLAGAQWALTALNGLVALLLVVAGYQVMSYRALDLQEQSVLGAVMRIAFGALAANLGFFFFLPQLIELCNLASMSFLGEIMHQAGGDVSLPLGAANLVTQPVSWAIFLLVHVAVSVVFIFVELARIALLDVCIMLAPFWVVLLTNEYTRAWGRLGATTFFSALLLQPLQVVIVGLGAGLIANFGKLNLNDPELCAHMSGRAHETCLSQLGHASVSASVTPIALCIGIATMYIAVKLPGMLFSQAVRASIGSVNQDVGRSTRAVLNGVAGALAMGRPAAT